jgi:hypothetical protein
LGNGESGGRHIANVDNGETSPRLSRTKVEDHLWEEKEKMSQELQKAYDEWSKYQGEQTLWKAEFLKQYGDTPVSFDGYFKYVFTFKGTASDGKSIVVTIGGNADEIYRLDISIDDEYRINDLHTEILSWGVSA